MNDELFDMVGACYTCNKTCNVMKVTKHMMVLTCGELVIASPRLFFEHVQPLRIPTYVATCIQK
eukprot:2791077-Ditylum_brightwellii.AAC.1